MHDQRHRRWSSIAAMPHQQTPDLHICYFNVGPASQTVDQWSNDIISTSCWITSIRLIRSCITPEVQLFTMSMPGVQIPPAFLLFLSSGNIIGKTSLYCLGFSCVDYLNGCVSSFGRSSMPNSTNIQLIGTRS